MRVNAMVFEVGQPESRQRGHSARVKNGRLPTNQPVLPSLALRDGRHHLPTNLIFAVVIAVKHIVESRDGSLMFAE